MTAVRLTGLPAFINSSALLYYHGRNHPQNGRDPERHENQTVQVAQNQDEIGDEVDRAESVADDAFRFTHFSPFLRGEEQGGGVGYTQTIWTL